MTLNDLTRIVKNNEVYFDRYLNGNFYYVITVDDIEYKFPVPLEDIGNSVMLYQDKALIFMRWIRKAIVNKTFVKNILTNK